MSNWDQDCEGKSYGSGNCGSDRDRGCKVALSRSSKFGLYQGSRLLMCPFIEPAVPPYGIYKDGGRHSNNRGCSMDLSRTGLCGSALTRLTETVFPKLELDVLPRKIDGCWALIVLCVLSLMTKPGRSRLFSIDFAGYGTYVSGLARLFDSSLPSWVDRKASLCGGFPWAGCKKYTSGRKLAIVVPPWCDKDPKGRMILSSRNHPKIGNNSPDQDRQQCLVVARSGNKGSNWERLGSLDLVTIGKCGKAQPKGCTVGHNRINSCSSIDVRGCNGNLAEKGNCKPAHGNWLGSGLPTWEVITPFKGEEGCGAFIVKSLLPLLSGPQATREAAYVNISDGHEHQLCPDKPEGNPSPFQFGDWLRVESINASDVNKRKSRPGIVYAPKGVPDGEVKDLKDKNNGATKGIDATDDVTLVDHERGTKGEASKAKEDCLAVISDQLGPLATPKAKSKNAKRSFKEKGKGASLKKLKKDKLGPCPSSDGVENEHEVVSPPKAPISVEAVNQPRREQ
ncbi:hypothetical protein V6N12_028659 [Hibiscus sabdariffa]|uniref:Uncharacterized protein n=1 Tax=Hibiscus sabdariffa TaxID=183260 RepID=A0ABR2F6G6_9ROSI